MSGISANTAGTSVVTMLEQLAAHREAALAGRYPYMLWQQPFEDTEIVINEGGTVGECANLFRNSVRWVCK